MIDLLSYPKTVTLGILALHFIFRQILARRRTSRYPLPPGPGRKPFIGNLLDLQTETPWKTYSDWAKQYGDIVYVEALGTKMLVLSSLKRTNDLLEVRASNYSDRPDFNMMSIHMGYGMFIGFMPYGLGWKRQRRTFHKHFNPQILPIYHPIMTSASAQLLQALLASPDRFAHHTRTYFNRIIVKTTYGIEISEEDDPFITMMQKVSEGINIAGIPGRFLVDVIPALKYVPRWMPGTGWRQFADYHKEKVFEARDRPFDYTLTSWQEGHSQPSVVARILEDLPPLGDPKRAGEEDFGRNCAATLYIAGADTSLASGMAFILAMATNPDIQKRAQAEIDSVVGPDRLPTVEDRPNLVYIEALLKELFRWHQVAPLAIPHLTVEDDIYDGYFIPKGTMVVGNAWHILHDEANFSNPDKFDPNRYIKDGKIDPEVVDMLPAFGFGRRACPGRNMALDSIFCMVAPMLAAFNISATAETHKTGFAKGLSMRPEPFECTISPRSARHEELIRRLDVS